MMWTGRGHSNDNSFDCREMNPSAATTVQDRKKRPANSRRKEKDKRRRALCFVAREEEISPLIDCPFPATTAATGQSAKKIYCTVRTVQ